MQNWKFVLPLLLAAPFAQAAPQTVILSIPSMDCEVCPITVKKSLEKIPGVGQVQVSFQDKQAVVKYDDAKAKVSQFLDATRKAGYPSEVKAAAAK